MTGISNKIYSIYFYFVLTIINIFFSGTHFFSLKNRMLNSIGLKVGKDTKIVGPIKIGRMMKLEIGQKCWIGTNFVIHGNGRVKLGDNCDVGPDVTILTGSHEIGNESRRAGKGVTYNSSIGDGIWIGSKNISTYILVNFAFSSQK